MNVVNLQGIVETSGTRAPIGELAFTASSTCGAAQHVSCRYESNMLC